MAMTLRLKPDLHARVARVAKEQGISINALIARAVVPYLQHHARHKGLMTSWDMTVGREEAQWREGLRLRHQVDDPL